MVNAENMCNHFKPLNDRTYSDTIMCRGKNTYYGENDAALIGFVQSPDFTLSYDKVKISKIKGKFLYSAVSNYQDC